MSTESEVSAVQAKLDAAVARIDELVSSYERFQSTSIPETIAQAIKDEWELNPIEAPEFSAAQASYYLTERRQDRKRLIRFGDAISILAQLEEALVDNLVRDELDLIIARYKRVEAAWNWLGENWNNLGQVISDIWDAAEEAWKFIQDGAPALVTHYLVVFSLPQLIKQAKTAAKVRDTFPSKLRRLALPQRIVKRVYRRKVSRL